MKQRLLFLSMLLCCGGMLLFGACSSEKSVCSGDFELMLSETGEVTSLTVKGEPVTPDFFAATSIEGTTAVPLSSKRIKKGWEFVKDVSGPDGKARITERFFATDNSIRWEVTVLGDEKPWSAPIQTQVRYPSAGARMWAPWGGPQIEAGEAADPSLRAALNLIPGMDWKDPLVPIPFVDTTYYYGAPYAANENTFMGPFVVKTDLLTIPFISILQPEAEKAFSVALSPEDLILDLTMETEADGTVTFSRLYHRIVASNPVTFALDLVAHDPDWRSGLSWMAERYPNYFYPTNSDLAFELNGTGGYSNHDVDFDIEKMKAMAFATNWQASFDFPYMGMFIPPVKDIHETWTRFGGDTTSIAWMRGYATGMKERGFHVLNYFNVTEFGNYLKIPAPAPTTTNPDEWWKNCNDYLWQVLPNAPLYLPEGMQFDNHGKAKGAPFHTWEGAIAMDCGDPAYKAFLLEQAARHLEWIKDADGFCIDRLDWLRIYNDRADDGVSWYEGKPARSLTTSYHALMAELGPMVHEAGKVIFVNNHTKRIDILKEVDGLFDEFTYNEAALNTTAFLTLKKPALGWTWDDKDLRKQGVDNFFQKYLYMGVFPMCPFPGNDHSIRPDEWVDRAYLDYGPLMQQMKYRTWVLSANPVTVQSGNAKANIFELPDGYVVPVVYAQGGEVELALGALEAGKSWQAEAYHPGKKEPVTLTPTAGPAGVTLTVPVERGCAMVKLF